ncbi:MAG: hypothetical protein GOMPHAMPRED_001725 [Gomphillus americanus]|uniref:NACHT-NTPase and P-loop NTPases N-terminal domain-containing protein n=1 Tax=Gomphillus americanus TaxID=1940652 RepID=A0A8H3F650_9LECA|nr:MAG: hypothetical protein GOMPHAMPRED_001725 [Gomphillus americanus]
MDPLSALGIATSAAQFIDFGFKVLNRIAEYNTASTKDVPRSLQSINIRLPLLLKSLSRAKSNAEIEKLDVDTKCMLRAVIAGCSTILSKIEDVLLRISKQPGESLASKMKKALTSFKADEIISSLDQDLQMYIHLLVLHHVVDRSEWSKMKVSHSYGHFIVKAMLTEEGERIRREKLLKELHSATSGVSLVNEPLCVVLHGPETVGKTQLALQYTHEAYGANHYSNVFWLDATSSEILLLGLQNLAEIIYNSKLGDETEKLRLVKEFLEGSVSPWLLVLDNCNQDSLSADLLPTKGKGAILFTTRQLPQQDGIVIRVPKFLTTAQHEETRRKMINAISDRHLDFIKETLLADFDVDAGADISANGWHINNGQSLVEYAASKDFTEGILELLEHGANLRYNKRHFSVVEWIGCNRSTYTMTAYLDWEDRKNYRAPSGDYEYAIQLSLGQGNIEIPMMLFDRRNLTFDSKMEQKGVVLAAENGHLDALQMLKSSGKLPSGEILTKAICKAILNDHLPVIKFLVDSGAPLDEYGEDAKTPLLEVLSRRKGTESSRNDLVVYLLDKGAAVDFPGQYTRKSALAEATQNKMISTMKILLSYGADPSVENRDGRNVLYFANLVKFPDAYPLLTTVESHLHQDYYGQGLFCAARTDDRDLLLSVWDKIDDKNARDVDGNTALLVAIRGRFLPISLLMVRKGADTTVQDSNRMSAWLHASQEGMYQLIRWMVDKGRHSLEERDSKGNTALMLATQQNEEGSHNKTIEILLKAGADQEAVNDYGETAQDIAETKEPKQVSQIPMHGDSNSNFYHQTSFSTSNVFPHGAGAGGVFSSIDTFPNIIR